MKLNCKQGDLAIIVDCVWDESSLGKIVKCISVFDTPWGKCWKVDPPWDLSIGTLDAHLRPIRDQPGEDETLTWEPVPHKETV